MLELPTDRPRPAVQSYRGSTINHLLSPELTAQLQQLSQREGATLFMTLLAAWQTLLDALQRAVATSASGRRSRAGRAPRWSRSSGSSSTRWCCAPG